MLGQPCAPLEGPSRDRLLFCEGRNTSQPSNAEKGPGESELRRRLGFTPLGQQTMSPCPRFFFCANGPIQLGFAYSIKQFLEERPRFVTSLDQVFAGEQRRRIEVVLRPLAIAVGNIRQSRWNDQRPQHRRDARSAIRGCQDGLTAS